jgi:uncharacterized protein (DUF1684 family)
MNHLTWVTLMVLASSGSTKQWAQELDAWRAEKDAEMRGPHSPLGRDGPAAVAAYQGLHYLPTSWDYRVPARFEPADAGRTLQLETTTGGVRILPLRGVLHFEIKGHKLSLDAFALSERPNDYFVIFKDATNGHQSYGAGRFLWVPGAVDGKTVLDFNQAWNPLCAYSNAFNCPIAPPENRLAIAIPVGEATYHEGH